jgi:glycosyl transferase, family 25
MTLALFYINLVRRGDRRRFMEAQFASLGVDAERVEARIPEGLPIASIARWTDPVRPRHVSPAELACTFSHRKVWRLIVKRDLPVACVLEDDAHLSPAFGRLAASRPVLHDFDIVKIEQRNLPTAIGLQVGELMPGIGLHRLYSYPLGACGYLITQAGARKLLERNIPLDVPVDEILFNPDEAIFHHLSVAQAMPGLIMASDRLRHEGTVADSDIAEAWQRRTQQRTVIPAPDPKRRAELQRRGEEDGVTLKVIPLAQ